MGIEWEQSGSKLPPLKKVVVPVVKVEELTAIAEVRLAAGDVPWGIHRHFYIEVLGMKHAETGADVIVFTYQRRQVALTREMREPGHAAFTVKEFDEMRMKMRDKHIAYELVHGESGMARMVYVRDPAGNWIHLMETRAF